LLERKFEDYKRNIWAIRYLNEGMEHWRVEGGPPNPDVHDFQQLCRSGVALLGVSPGVPSTFAEMSRSNPDDYTIWLRFVYELYPPLKSPIVSTQVQNGNIEI
jgi:hypothetical protein